MITQEHLDRAHRPSIFVALLLLRDALGDSAFPSAPSFTLIETDEDLARAIEDAVAIATSDPGIDGLDLSMMGVVRFGRTGPSDDELRRLLNGWTAMVAGPGRWYERNASRLTRLADMHLQVRPPRQEHFAQAIAHFSSDNSPVYIPPALAGKLTLGDLDLVASTTRTSAQIAQRLLRLHAVGEEPRSRGWTTPRLSEMAGLGAAGEWGLQLAGDLRDYLAGRLEWSEVDRGALIGGPPGTGKSTFAKALALEAGVPLVMTSYAEWQSSRDGHLGELLKAMKKTFTDATAEIDENGAAIIAIDEIDSVQSRDSDSRHRDWWTAIINALLALIDGQTPGLVVLGMSNYADRVDAALRRPGRLDRTLEIPLPDAVGLVGILRSHLGPDLQVADLSAVAVQAVGSTGADIEQIVRSARRRARTASRELRVEDLVAEVREIRPQLEDGLMERVAVHEAGHAVARLALCPSDRVTARITSDGGVTEGSREVITLRSQMVGGLEDELVISLAGRAAELSRYGEAMTGSGGDEKGGPREGDRDRVEAGNATRNRAFGARVRPRRGDLAAGAAREQVRPRAA